MTETTPSPKQAFAGLDHAGLLACQAESFKEAVNTRADVLLLEHEGFRAVLKDYSRSSRGFAFLIAPWLVYRETRALRQLESVAGVPVLFRKVSSRAFLMEYLPATRIRTVREELNAPEFVRKVRYLVDELHNHGVVHGDLRNATNILVDTNNDPVFVDFVSAVLRGHRYNPLSAALYSLCLPIDEGALVKLKEKYAPELLDEKDRASSSEAGPLERVARWVSVHGRNLIQRVFR